MQHFNKCCICQAAKSIPDSNTFLQILDNRQQDASILQKAPGENVLDQEQ